MPIERRQKLRPAADSGVKGLSNAELDKAIRELNAKVEALMAERQARHMGRLQPGTSNGSNEGGDQLADRDRR